MAVSVFACLALVALVVVVGQIEIGSHEQVPPALTTLLSVGGMTPEFWALTLQSVRD